MPQIGGSRVNKNDSQTPRRCFFATLRHGWPGDADGALHVGISSSSQGNTPSFSWGKRTTRTYDYVYINVYIYIQQYQTFINHRYI